MERILDEAARSKLIGKYGGQHEDFFSDPPERDYEDDYGKELQEPGNCEQCHEMLARIDEQRGHSLCSDCRWQKSIDEAD